MSEEGDFESIFLRENTICKECQTQFKKHKKIYLIDGIEWHVLYEYNEFIERLFFQYKEQKDIALSKVFLFDIKNKLKKVEKKYNLCGMCSSSKKYLERGFDALFTIFKSHNIFLYQPLYKKKDVKQSEQTKEDRRLIKNIIERKQAYPLRKEKICLIDDVCTTGASMKKGCELLKPDIVFIIAAHPLWIESHKENIVEKKGVFW